MGGAIILDGLLTIETSTFSSNSATYFGGGIFAFCCNTLCELKLEAVTFIENVAHVSAGGAIYRENTVFTDNGVVYIENSA